MAKIARRVLDYRERQSRGAIMRPSTFAAIEREAAASGATDPQKVAGAAYWKTLAARYRDAKQANPREGDRILWVDAIATDMLENYRSMRRAGMSREEATTRAIRESVAGPATVAEFSRRVQREEERGGNPIQMQIRQDPAIKKFLASMYDQKFGNLYATGYTKKEAAKNLREEWRRARKAGTWRNPGSILDEIRHGDKVTILVPAGIGREGQEWKRATGRAVMRGPHGWVLNMGGPHGRPAVASESNIVSVRKTNPTKTPKRRKRESVPDYHKRRVRELVAKMPPQIRAVFDRNPSGYQFIFTNPEGDLSGAEDLYKTFHGRDPREILEITESAETRGEYTGLGDLVELTIDAPNGDRVIVKFKDDGVRLASSPEGTQLYLLGGNQDISSLLGKFGADSSKDLADLGELKQLVYEAAKWQTDFTPQEWKHDLGEESGIRPRAFFDQLKKKIFFAGGNYRVKRPGIVD